MLVFMCKNIIMQLKQRLLDHIKHLFKVSKAKFESVMYDYRFLNDGYIGRNAKTLINQASRKIPLI